MSTPDEFAKELAKQLPLKEIYADAAAPAAKQTGQLLEDLVKCLQLALAPVQWVAALQDRYRAFVDRSVRRVPEERRVSPAPQIAGPVLEAIRYEPEGTPIDEMFSELLSRSMDKERVGEAHPSYPSIIRQLSSDEAKIIKMLREKTYPFIQVWKLDGPLSRFERTEVDDLPRSDLFFPENVPFYIDHLNSLGLAGIWQVPPQEPLFEHGRQIGNRVRSEYRLTPFGSRFATACIST